MWDHRVVAIDFQHLAAADRAVGQLDLAQLVVSDALHFFDHHQRTVDLLDRLIFPDHTSSPPFSAHASISPAMLRAIPA